MKKLPISVYLIAGAEAHRIGRALASVADWTSEIIVVLNEEVTDGTDEIARAYGTKVSREPWKGFAAQKNSALEKASQKWVLGLDADEIISAALRDEILRTLEDETSATRFAAYSFPRCSLYCGRWIRHGDWYPDRCVRLCQLGCGRWEGADPHPHFEVAGPVGCLQGDLEHHSMESINKQIEKTVAYADEFARSNLLKGRRVTGADLWFRPAWRFIRAYFFKLGFLDGWQGYSIAWLTAFYTFLRYVRVREEEGNQRRQAKPEL